MDLTRGDGPPTAGTSTVGASAELTTVTSTPHREQKSASAATGVPHFWQRLELVGDWATAQYLDCMNAMPGSSASRHACSTSASHLGSTSRTVASKLSTNSEYMCGFTPIPLAL